MRNRNRVQRFPHTRAIQRDRSKHRATEPDAEQIEQLMEDLIKPSTVEQVTAYRNSRFRDRKFTLPLAMAFVLSLIWRQSGSVREGVRELNKNGMLWAPMTKISQQAVHSRLQSLPAALFEKVFNDILPKMEERWQNRKRPISPGLRFALEQFKTVVAIDGSTLDALVRKSNILRLEVGDKQPAPLAGRILGIINLGSKLPQKIYFEENPKSTDQNFWGRVIEYAQPGMLLIFDLGFVKYDKWDELTENKVSFITRAMSNMSYRVEKVLQNRKDMVERLVWIGSSKTSYCKHLMRLVEYKHNDVWYRYVTNIVEPEKLPSEYVVGLYRQRWRIEEAFHTVKRILGLSYFYSSLQNGILLQIWCTWILYCVVIDLTDEVAEELELPFATISVEMVYRGLYHYSRAIERGEDIDPIRFLVENVKILSLIKQKRKKLVPSVDLLDLIFVGNS